MDWLCKGCGLEGFLEINKASSETFNFFFCNGHLLLLFARTPHKASKSTNKQKTPRNPEVNE
jgi:hypothetical protein